MDDEEIRQKQSEEPNLEDTGNHLEGPGLEHKLSSLSHTTNKVTYTHTF